MQIRRKFDEQGQPDTRALNRALYALEASGTIEKCTPAKGKHKPRWKVALSSESDSPAPSESDSDDDDASDSSPADDEAPIDKPPSQWPPGTWPPWGYTYTSPTTGLRATYF